MKINIFLVMAFLGLSVVSCTKTDEPNISDEALNVNTFVLEYMDFFYLWTDKIPDNLNVSSTEDSKAFFDKVIYKGTDGTYDEELEANRDGDRWSFITDDLDGLLDYFNGIRTSSGYYPYSYIIEDGSNKLALVVAYVYDNTPASDAGLQRGSVIMEIDGNELTTDNINELYSQESYTITMGKYDFDNKEFIVLNETKSINKVEINTNPIIKSEIYNINGIKVAYLLYNSFIHNYDDELISVFENYKSQGVTELVLDFRYNGGGAVTSALNISGMIAPQSAIGEVFLKKQYNSELQDLYLNDPNYGEEYLENNLSDKAYGYEGDGGIVGMDMPNLDLSRVYVIGQHGTASASELVINGLRPYMNVVTVGENTHGKYTASSTLKNKDYPNWAIQPIIFKSANADGVSDYWDGFEPVIVASDQPIYGDFGYDEISGTWEPMLMKALSDMSGIVAKKQNYEIQQHDVIIMPVENVVLSTTMIYDVE